MAEYAYSLNEEDYYGRFDDRDDAATEGAQDYRDRYDEEPTTILTAEIVQRKAGDYLPGGDSIIEMMQENAYDDCIDHAADWLTGLKTERGASLGELLKSAVNEWADKHGYQPTFFTVRNIEETPAPPLAQTAIPENADKGGGDMRPATDRKGG